MCISRRLKSFENVSSNAISSFYKDEGVQIYAWPLCSPGLESIHKLVCVPLNESIMMSLDDSIMMSLDNTS